VSLFINIDYENLILDSVYS